MSDKRVRKFLQVGTMECMLLCMGIALLVGIGLFTIGFWKTAVLGLLLGLGVFIGGVTNKREVLSRWYNRLFPARAQLNARNQQLVEQVRRTVSNADFDDQPEPVSVVQESAAEVKEAVQDLAFEVREQAEDLAQDTVEAVQEKAEAAQEAVCDACGQAAECVQDAAEAVQAKAEAAQEAVCDVCEQAAEAAQDAAADLAGQADQAVSDIQEEFEKKPE